MITVKFLGGAKKSFSVDRLDVDKSGISINELLAILSSLKPKNTPELDVENTLIAVNGADSSALDGKMTVIKSGDVVSIIPVIHGGAPKKNIFQLHEKPVLMMEIKGQKKTNVAFLEDLRKNFPNTKIQAISSRFVLNISHAKKIISLSLLSQKNGVLLSNKLETDILMRFALTSQISDAINFAGLKPGKNFFLIAVGDKRKLDLLCSELLQYSTASFSNDNTAFLKKQFGIDKKQLATVLSKSPLEDLLVERAAILF